MFKPIRTLDGSLGVTRDLAVDQVDITEGDVLFWATSGYVSNPKNASATTNLTAGVAVESISASDVTVGATTISANVNFQTVYRVDTSAAVTQSEVGTNVGFDQDGTADGAGNQYIQEAINADTGLEGICRIINMVATSVSGTFQAADVVLNVGAPSHL